MSEGFIESTIQIEIPSFSEKYVNQQTVTFFVINCTNLYSNQKWSLEKQFDDFSELEANLAKIIPDTPSIEGKSVCLNSNGGGGGAKTGLYKIDLPDGEYIIRKLTPVECERLQTLPDNYTEGISNSSRYKALGNGWTVDVIAHILKGIKEDGKI